MSTKTTTINKLWFKNRLKNNELLVKCNLKLTDDYAFDNAYNFFKEDNFREIEKDEFKDWYINRSHIYGNKKGIINMSFANCEYYEFKLK